ncbi:MAG: sulfatase-like hydrolase/transferase [Thermoleophilia bacterium]|nr:sulfatase-like hydrolase/transferase [Thermoleophilia bacterium]
MREGLRAWGELTGIWALAVAYPLLTASVSGIDGLTSVRVDRFDVILFVLLVVFAVPALGFLLEFAAGLISTRLRKGLHAGLLGLATSVFVLRFAVDHGLTDWKGVALALVAAALLAAAYVRSDFLKSMAAILMISTPVVIVVFAVSGPVSALFTPDSPATAELRPTSTPPVVMLLMDELPLAAIESRPGVIDGKRFPNLVRLVRQTTWYPGALSATDSTVIAAPTLLTGTVPDDGDAPPGLPDYPDNLFNILDRAGYDVWGGEWITDICPHDVCARTRDLSSRLTRLMTNGWEYGRPIPLPEERDLVEAARFRDRHDPLPAQAKRVGEFVKAIESGDHSALVLHLMLPHVPWEYLPDGKKMNGTSITAELTGPPNEVKGQLQRMMLQAEFLDSQVGRIVKAMKSAGIWNESLFIALADHGATMQGGLPRRSATDETSGWLLPIPLFIKYPGQENGKTVHRTVTTTDLLPTVLNTLGLDTEDPSLDPSKRSLASDQPPPTDIDVVSTVEEPFTIATAEVKRRYRRAVAHVNALFPDPSLYVSGGHGDLLGERAAPAAGELKRLGFTNNEPAFYEEVDPGGYLLPAVVSGTVEGDGLNEQTSLAVAVNGTIAGTARPWTTDGVTEFATVVDPSYFTKGPNAIEVFRVTP